MQKPLYCLLLIIFFLLPIEAQSESDTCPSGQIRVNDVCGDTSPDSLQPGWNKIEPGGDTICAHGDAYTYWVRPGINNKLLIHFEGGGGCWNYDTCKPGSSFYDATVGENEIRNYQAGIFDFENPENPFKDYTFVFAPVCTGDVHTGSNTETYTSGDQTLTIHHMGFINSSAAVEWAYQHIANPDSIFVTGCSAGSMGSIFFAPYIINHYPDKPVYQLGDSLAFVFPNPLDLQTDYHTHDNFPDWIPTLDNILPGKFTSAQFYSAIANYYPNQTFAEYNSLHDQVQRFFYGSIGVNDQNWVEDLEASLNKIHTNAPNFRSFTAGGDLHCVTPRDEFYTYQVNGIRFRDWIADMANGKAVTTLHCDNCDQPELYQES